MSKTAYVKGKSYYSFTTKTNESGKYPSHRYEVNLTDAVPELPEYGEIVNEFIKDGKLKIANSKYPIPMFDMTNVKLDQPVGLSNGTELLIFVERNTGENGDYLICKAIKVCEPIEDFNPFKNKK